MFKTRNGDARVFSELENLNQGKVAFRDKNYGKNIGIGKVSKNPPKSIKNVCLVDGLRFNLLSISQMG